MIPFIEKLREFLRPIDDARLPHLRSQMTRAAKGISAILAVLTPLGWLTTVLIQHTHVARVTLHSMFSWLLALCIYRAATRDRVHPQGLLFALATATSVNMSIIGMLNESPVRAYFGSVSSVVLMFAVFIPWRPTLSLLLAVPAIGMAVLGHYLHLPLPVPVLATAYIALSTSFVSAVGVQVQRGLWVQLENTRSQLVATNRMSTLGRMTAGIAHELKTPLAAALNGLERSTRLTTELRDSIGHPDVTPDDLRELSQELDETIAAQRTSLARATSFVLAIRAQTRSSNTALCVDFNVSDKVGSVVGLLGYRLKTSRVIVDTSGLGAQTQLTGDPMRFEQVLTNLIGNALDACDESGRGTVIKVGCEPRRDGLMVTVHDDGPGVPEALRERIFEPLFTTRAHGAGTGLGLHIAREIAESTFGGTLVLDSTRGGARFELWCPRLGARAVEQAAWTPYASEPVAAR